MNLPTQATVEKASSRSGFGIRQVFYETMYFRHVEILKKKALWYECSASVIRIRNKYEFAHTC